MNLFYTLIAALALVLIMNVGNVMMQIHLRQQLSYSALIDLCRAKGGVSDIDPAGRFICTHDGNEIAL